jgi:sugar phosphate isomerase/epimerase
MGAAATLAAGAVADEMKPVPVQDRICLFTDHLDDYGYTYKEVASMLKQLRVAGPDLTVRPGGLVPPERVAEELPRAVAAFREEGLTVPMISTGLASAKDAAAAATLAAAGKLGIGHYKLGYFRYEDAARWREQLDATRRELEGLVRLGREARVQAGFHNHSGPFVGGAIWDSWEVLQPLDPLWIGFYFDPAQATIEGGSHAWKLNFHRISGRLKMIALKDFVWEKSGGGWRTRWCPLGEGMVRWPEFFKSLARVSFTGPISLHIEYDPGGATRAVRFENSFAAAERDLKFLRGQLDAAFAKPAQKN